jgi:protein translocase SecG subunit
MMTLLIGFLTLVLVLNCVILVFLILIQLPKKEAGAGMAFGGAATDALFGAGSGNALTKMTKYSGAIFVGISLTLSFLNANRAKDGNRRLEEELKKVISSAPAVPVSQPATPTSPQSPALETTNLPGITLSNPAAANPSTNPAAAPVISTPLATNSPANPAVAPQTSTNSPDGPAGKK